MRGRIAALSVGIAFAICILPAPAAEAVVFYQVNSFADEPDQVFNGICWTASGHCTLRAAITESSGVDTIIALPSGVYGLTADIAIPADWPFLGSLDVRGAGRGSTVIDGGGLVRHFRVPAERVVRLSGLTLRNGKAAGSEAGSIYSEGHLTIEDCLIEGNVAGAGGGIYVDSFSLNVVRSTIRGNSATFDGGGIYVANTATTVNVTDSTISGNAAEYGGGIANNSLLYLTNSTISSNDSLQNGGGIHNSATGSVWAYNATVAFNQADSDSDVNGGIGGGVYTIGAFSLRNSVIGANYRQGSQNNPNDCQGSMNTYGWNKFYSSSDCPVTHGGACGGADSQLGSISFLEPLRSNGGPTETHSISSNSDLRNGVLLPCHCQDKNGTELTADQRGGVRPVQSVCDIGAFEYEGLPLGLIFEDGFESVNLLAW